jgi:hypothetical protein
VQGSLCLFDEILEKQLVLKNVMTVEEWQDNQEQQFAITFKKTITSTELERGGDSEQKDSRSLDSISNYTGDYFSKEWVRKNILLMSDEDIEDMRKQMEEEQETEPDDEMVDEPAAPPPPQPVTIVEPPKPA